MIDKTVEICYNEKDNATYVGGVLVDRITQSFLQEFSTNFGFEKLRACLKNEKDCIILTKS